MRYVPKSTDGRGAERTIREFKRTVDGRTQTFDSEALLVSKRLTVVKFRLVANRVVGGFSLLAGGYTLGYFWTHRNYLLYRFCDPNGDVIAHRFDIIARPTLWQRSVSYRDLVVDVWVAPDGTVTTEDEDELDGYVASGKVTPREVAVIDRTHRLLVSEHARIIGEAERIAEALQFPGEDGRPS